MNPIECSNEQAFYISFADDIQGINRNNPIKKYLIANKISISIFYKNAIYITNQNYLRKKYIVNIKYPEENDQLVDRLTEQSIKIIINKNPDFICKIKVFKEKEVITLAPIYFSDFNA